MKSLVYHQAFDVRYEDADLGPVGEEEALIKVSHAGICGSDINAYIGKHPRVRPPVTLGHEFSGIITEINTTRSDLKVGDRVASQPLIPCNACYACEQGAYNACINLKHLGLNVPGGMAEYVKAPVLRTYKLPDSMTMEEGAMVEPTAVGVYAIRRAGVGLDDRVVVLGGGPIGLLLALAARVASGRNVDIVEVNDWRIGFLRKLGFDPIDGKSVDVQAEVLKRTNGKGADILFDAAGSAALSPLYTTMTRVRGKIIQVAMPKVALPLELQPLAVREQTIMGCRAYNSEAFVGAIDLIASGAIDIKPLMTHVMPLQDGKEGLEIAKKGEQSMKVLLKP